MSEDMFVPSWTPLDINNQEVGGTPDRPALVTNAAAQAGEGPVGQLVPCDQVFRKLYSDFSLLLWNVVM